MVVLLGNNFSTKRKIISRMINVKHVEDSKDIKAYYFKLSYIVNTPSLFEFNDFEIMLRKCNFVAGLNLSACVLIIDDTLNSYIIHNLVVACEKMKMKIIFFNENNYFNIMYSSNIEVICKYNEIIEFIENNMVEEYKVTAKFIFLGITNVGKSTIVNKFIGFDVFSMKDARGTTKEILSLPVKYKDENILLYDTFGLENKTQDRLFGLKKTLFNVDRAFIVVDCMTYQRNVNLYISNFLYEINCNFTFLLNKVDLINHESRVNVMKYMSFKYPSSHVLCFSSKDDRYVPSLIIDHHYSIKKTPISNTLLNKAVKGRFFSILYIRNIVNVKTRYKFIVTVKRGCSKPNIISLKNFIARSFNIKDIVLEFIMFCNDDNRGGDKKFNKFRKKV